MRRLLLACAVSGMLVTGAMAKDDSLGVTTTLTTGLNGSYLFRGTKLATNGLASSAAVKYDISRRLVVKGTLWNYTRLGSPHTDAIENDYDVCLSWTPPVAKDLFTLSVGNTYYDRLKAGAPYDASEFYGAVALNVPWTPTLTGYYQYLKPNRVAAGSKTSGGYLRFSVGNSFKMKGGWTAGISGWAGISTGASNIYSARLRKGGFQDAGIRTNFTYELSPGLTITPGVDWIIPGVQLRKLSTGFVVPNPGVNFAWTRSF